MTPDEYNHGLDRIDRIAEYLQREGFQAAQQWVRGDDSKGSLLRSLADAGNIVAAVRQAYIENITPNCPFCDLGSVDSGGVTPWGEAIFVACGVCGGTGISPETTNAISNR